MSFFQIKKTIFMQSKLKILNAVVLLLLIAISSCTKEEDPTPDPDPAEIPKLGELTVTAVGLSTATLSSSVTEDGKATVSDRGFVWSEAPNPTTTLETKISIGMGLGNFEHILTNLSPNTTYFVRAFATNSVGTAYGNEVSFKTIEITPGIEYQGGIVAYILKEGDPGYIPGEQHGLIVAPTNLDSRKLWGCLGASLTDARSRLIGSGRSNTEAIITAGCADVNHAATLCNIYVNDDYDDWFLPSYDELVAIQANINLLPEMRLDEYWSSTDHNSNFAMFYDFNSASGTIAIKAANLFVRPFRYF